MAEENKKNKWYKRKKFYIIGVIALLVISVVYANVKKANKAPTYETVKVESGVLSQTVDATGNVESANELDLRFETSGKLVKIFKDVNTEVKAGDIIAELDLSGDNARVAQASASVQRSKANLDKILAGATNDYILSIKSTYDKAQASLEQIKANSADAVANAEAVVKTAENNLELSAGGENSQIVENAYQDLVATIQSVQNSLSSALTESDNILGVDNTLANDSYEDVLSALDSSKLNSAKDKYGIAKSAKNKVDSASIKVSLNANHDDIASAGKVAEDGLIAAKDLLYAVSQMLDATVPIGNLTQTGLSTLKSTISASRVDVTSKYTILINQLQAVDNAKNSYSTYQIAYDKAKENLKNAETRAQADISSAEASVRQAEAQYNDVKNPARSEDVSSARAQLYESQASLSQAVSARNKGRIVAPIAGTVGKVNVKVGEFVSATEIAVKLVNPNMFEIRVDIPETDIIKIAVGNDADITLDAYGEDHHFVGKVSEIETGETVIQDVVYYKVTVAMEDSNTDEFNILNGMTANILFYTEQKENALYIPQRAIKTDDSGKKYVRVLKGTKVEDVYVDTGLRGDNGLIEITSGLQAGEDVVLRDII
ncbi:MAG: efflux RND transporter periplasmic adaptor subunit [Patescibacteria group bacterium]|nr:efflux RND transporter periplasmic adaptor subunit [Patescibacteria group bacterium]